MCKNTKFCIQLTLGGIREQPTYKTILLTIHINLHHLILEERGGRREGEKRGIK